MGVTAKTSLSVENSQRQGPLSELTSGERGAHTAVEAAARQAIAQLPLHTALKSSQRRRKRLPLETIAGEGFPDDVERAGVLSGRRRLQADLGQVERLSCKAAIGRELPSPSASVPGRTTESVERVRVRTDEDGGDTSDASGGETLDGGAALLCDDFLSRLDRVGLGPDCRLSKLKWACRVSGARYGRMVRSGEQRTMLFGGLGAVDGVVRVRSSEKCSREEQSAACLRPRVLQGLGRKAGVPTSAAHSASEASPSAFRFPAPPDRPIAARPPVPRVSPACARSRLTRDAALIDQRGSTYEATRLPQAVIKVDRACRGCARAKECTCSCEN